MKSRNTGIEEYESKILESFMFLPSSKLLKHRFELDTDYLAGHVSRFLKGERFNYEINIFSTEEVQHINSLINDNTSTADGKNLDVISNVINLVCKILNKYMI